MLVVVSLLLEDSLVELESDVELELESLESEDESDFDELDDESLSVEDELDDVSLDGSTCFTKDESDVASLSMEITTRASEMLSKLALGVTTMVRVASPWLWEILETVPTTSPRK